MDSCTQAPVENSVTSACPVLTTPRIAVTENCSTETPSDGTCCGPRTFVFTGKVSNLGNVTLVNITVVNSQPTNGTPVIGPITLAPGASTNFTGSYTLPVDCCQIIDTLTARGQDACAGTRVSATSTQICPIITTPRLTVTRVCPAAAVPVGGLFEFSGLVSNAGDITLTNVYVFSSQPNANTPILGPIELAPGESEEFSGSYTVTAGIRPSGDTVTASGTDTCKARTVTAKANCAGPVLDSVPTVVGPVSVVAGMLKVFLTATPGVTYCLQSQSGLKDSTWENLPGNVTAVGATAFKEDFATEKQRFYRVMIVQE